VRVCRRCHAQREREREGDREQRFDLTSTHACAAPHRGLPPCRSPAVVQLNGRGLLRTTPRSRRS
jgi:hypothetical protein